MLRISSNIGDFHSVIYCSSSHILHRLMAIGQGCLLVPFKYKIITSGVSDHLNISWRSLAPISLSICSTGMKSHVSVQVSPTDCQWFVVCYMLCIINYSKSQICLSCKKEEKTGSCKIFFFCVLRQMLNIRLKQSPV